MKDYYKILRIARFSSIEQIHSQFLKIAQDYDPEKHEGEPFIKEFYNELKEAHKFLTHPGNKVKYDDLLLNNPEIVNVQEFSRKITNKAKINFNFFGNIKFIHNLTWLDFKNKFPKFKPTYLLVLFFILLIIFSVELYIYNLAKIVDNEPNDIPKIFTQEEHDSWWEENEHFYRPSIDSWKEKFKQDPALMELYDTTTSLLYSGTDDGKCQEIAIKELRIESKPLKK
ncbi:MAG: DnaJ domain-containing protein [Bacteroidetes bacterium]|nr:DnaJ domain-containing protein [Bacteroidota bacterium]